MKAVGGGLTSRIVAACFFSLISAAAVKEAKADYEFTIDEPHVYSIQPRAFRLGHEFQLGFGVLPLDAYYLGAVLGASYTYHFTDFWAWEIASAGYSFNFDTGLKAELLENYNVQPVRGGGEQIVFFGSSSLLIKPLFGKLALFNEKVILSETFFSVGFGPFKGNKSAEGSNEGFWRPAIALGMGMRFWKSEGISFRFDVRDYLVFSQIIPENVLLFMLSASFNFRNAAAASGGM